MKNEFIEKPWVVYGWFHGLWDIGRVINESLDIQHDEEREYVLKHSSNRIIKTFQTSEEAINYCFETQLHKSGCFDSTDAIFQRVLSYFPKATKLEAIQFFYNTLIAHQKKRGSS
ncbi:Uncharacterised protein [uncultured archaeon]|nr:Uncharacterised protein [uncultured archaeon]